MKITYLIDTDWIINHLLDVRTIIDKLEELKPEGLSTSIICLAEVYEGIYYSRDAATAQKGLDCFLEDVAVVGIDQETSKIFGQERGRLRKQGNLIGDFDLLIASTCLAHNLILLSNNRRHFERIKDLNIISLDR